MGTWGVAVFSDDLAADVRDDFRDLIGEGLPSTQAVEKLLAEHSASVKDEDEAPVFWIALALTQWKLGRLEERTKHEALQAIESGQGLRRWEASNDRGKRAAILEKARTQLLSPQPPPKRVPRRVKAANDWQVGEVIGLRLHSGRWTLIRVIDHHSDKGGRFAVCELLDWAGDQIPPAAAVEQLSLKKLIPPRTGDAQFMFPEPRKKQDLARLQRLGMISAPAQKRRNMVVMGWPRLDGFLEEWFGLK
jgi:hypothetical protein